MHRFRPVTRWVAAVSAALMALAFTASPAQAQVAGFSDVKGNEYYATAVAWMAEQEFTTGIGDTGLFKPHEEVTRAQLVTFLWRIEGSPDGYGPHGFTDVPEEGTWYSDAVRWAKAEGVTTGVWESNRFAPTEPVSRAQAATFMWRFVGEPGPNPHHGFTDVPAGSWFDEAVRWLKAEELTTGIGGTDRYAPHETLTRGQMATFLWRMAGEPPPPDPGDAVDCDDFETQADAQAWFDLYEPHYGDVAELDGNSNGIACEAGDEDAPLPV